MIVINERDKDYVIEKIMEAARSGTEGHLGTVKSFVTPVAETYPFSSGKVDN